MPTEPAHLTVPTGPLPENAQSKGHPLTENAQWPRSCRALASLTQRGGSLWPSSTPAEARQLDRPVSEGNGNFLLADVRNQVRDKIDCSRTIRYKNWKGA